MNTTAISGRRQFAIKSAEDVWWLLNEASDLSWRQIRPCSASTLLDRCSDLQWIQTQDEQEVRAALGFAIAQCSSLDFVLFLFDQKLSLDTRRKAALQLEELLGIECVEQYLEDIFFSKPLSHDIDLSLPIQVFDAKTRGLQRFVDDLTKLQNVIVKVRNAWDVIPFGVHSQKQTREEFESRCLQLGFFRRVVRSFGNRNELSTLQVSLACDPRLKHDFPGLSHLMHAWIQPLTKDPDANSRRQQLRTEMLSSRIHFEDRNRTTQESEELHHLPTHKNAQDALEAAQSQVRKIVEFAKQHKDAQASSIRMELVNSQLKSASDGTFAIKSLCNIASKLRGIRDDFAMECLNQAVLLPQGGDSQAYLQLGTALADAHNFDLAKTALEVALRRCSPLEVQASTKIKSKLAHILSEQHDYAAALSMLDMIGEKNETRSVAIAKADVLRKMGEYGKALAGYVAIRDSKSRWNDPDFFEASHRAQAGIAEVARRLGNPHRAIRIYRKLIYQTPNGIDEQSLIVYKVSLAQLLKLVGQFDRSRLLAELILQQSSKNQRAISLIETLDAIDAMEQPLTSGPRMEVRGKRDQLDEQIAISKRILADEPLSPLSDVIYRFGLDDFTSIKLSLESFHAMDRFSREMSTILELHSRIAQGETAGLVFPKFKRSPKVFRDVISALQALDLEQALRLEVYAMLLAA